MQVIEYRLNEEDKKLLEEVKTIFGLSDKCGEEKIKQQLRNLAMEKLISKEDLCELLINKLLREGIKHGERIVLQNLVSVIDSVIGTREYLTECDNPESYCPICFIVKKKVYDRFKKTYGKEMFKILRREVERLMVYYESQANIESEALS
ncbi:MAG: hypothetical protein ACPLKS_08185 [Caldisericum exile]|uniref:hypothetical protein n=1 Tax=Caldisericum exile TaxID=693075 RepID=UPI003C75F781